MFEMLNLIGTIFPVLVLALTFQTDLEFGLANVLIVQ
jgi:hypothetical protein